ncbi:MAG: phospho-N-acetylmuramoyl-pentapeptide-transferase [Persephonella sp.]|nr:MAG: phospho-N-acetylmuramoyl-pentapeptide-transferase [Persephonella sp.]RUM61925.1 MAG: phospho-N-acetylmuramoyl-pentapeptide-transferase [Persephonella sp.]
MFYYLFYEVLDINIFKYITFRGFYALITAFLISILLGPYIIKILKRHQKKEGGYVREDTPERHQQKKNTPTMGGILLIVSVFLSSLLWCRLDNLWVLIILITMLAFFFIGYLDDYIKLKNKTGLRSKTKFLLQLAFATFIATLIYINPFFDTNLYFPFFKSLTIDLGILYIPFIVFMIVGTSNAVNLTDGLDGLAIGPTLITAATYIYISYIVGNFILAKYLYVPYIYGVGEISVFLMALIGGGLGFLWFNSFPAEMFMGDTGSLSIGAVLGVVAVITKQEFLLAIVGGIFVLETVSVILQVLSFKTTRKRIFKMAPIHHHFELIGIPEPKIVVRVWIITIILAIIAISTLKIR